MREGILTHGGSYGLKCESNSTKPPEEDTINRVLIFLL